MIFQFTHEIWDELWNVLCSTNRQCLYRVFVVKFIEIIGCWLLWNLWKWSRDSKGVLNITSIFLSDTDRDIHRYHQCKQDHRKYKNVSKFWMNNNYTVNNPQPTIIVTISLYFQWIYGVNNCYMHFIDSLTLHICNNTLRYYIRCQTPIWLPGI